MNLFKIACDDRPDKFIPEQKVPEMHSDGCPKQLVINLNHFFHNWLRVDIRQAYRYNRPIYSPFHTLIITRNTFASGVGSSSMYERTQRLDRMMLGLLWTCIMHHNALTSTTVAEAFVSP
ncbi:hypothetical protein TNCV_1223651 [Trichonephila clavipes]|nr:hypothetical protein TNCV_1223651 [Trichonephila clavipes]